MLCAFHWLMNQRTSLAHSSSSRKARARPASSPTTAVARSDSSRVPGVLAALAASHCHGVFQFALTVIQLDPMQPRDAR
jgi:hypothetical protein